MKKLVYHLTRIFWKITRIIGQFIPQFQINLKTISNQNGEIEHTYISFISKYQLPLIMVITEYRDKSTNDVYFATCKSIL